MQKYALAVVERHEVGRYVRDDSSADFVADFWLEGDKEGNCRVCLTVKTAMDYAKKSELIEVATNKSNAASVGIMGKIRDMMENCLYAQNYANSFVGDYCSASPAGLNSGCLWSLNQYRRKTQEEFPNEDNDDFNPALDELEKSIVAHIADEITVAVKGNTAQMIIEKNFGKH